LPPVSSAAVHIRPVRRRPVNPVGRDNCRSSVVEPISKTTVGGRDFGADRDGLVGDTADAGHDVGPAQPMKWLRWPALGATVVQRSSSSWARRTRRACLPVHLHQVVSTLWMTAWPVDQRCSRGGGCCWADGQGMTGEVPQASNGFTPTNVNWLPTLPNAT